jgi:agmatinase
MTFDPDAAATGDSGIFGLPFTREQARIILIPVPFDATTSYRAGTRLGPEAILNASRQVDLFDRRFGRVYEQGIYMEPIDGSIASLSQLARRLSGPIIERGGASDADSADVMRINEAGEHVNAFTHRAASEVLAAGKVPAIIGGDHSTPFGAIRACAEFVAAKKQDLGILHIDAHMDLRDAFEGFRWSHASIMFNVLKEIPGVKKLVQVGIRDFGEGEMDLAIEQGRRIVTHYDDQWSEELAAGRDFADLCRRAIDDLPAHVYISFDIDGLDPSLCPHTGTPVPGGLSFHQASALLLALRESGRTVVGFDLVEVCPGPSADEPEWDANVGARILYKLCGAAARTA